jgi:hypothetical protein
MQTPGTIVQFGPGGGLVDSSITETPPGSLIVKGSVFVEGSIDLLRGPNVRGLFLGLAKGQGSYTSLVPVVIRRLSWLETLKGQALCSWSVPVVIRSTK